MGSAASHPATSCSGPILESQVWERHRTPMLLLLLRLCWELVAGGGEVPKCQSVDPQQTLQKLLPVSKVDVKWTPWHLRCLESLMAEQVTKGLVLSPTEPPCPSVFSGVSSKATGAV